VYCRHCSFFVNYDNILPLLRVTKKIVLDVQFKYTFL